MKSIFEIENRLDITKEFSKFIEVFHEDTNAVLVREDYHTSTYMTFIDAIENTVFLKWKYRDTFLDIDEYLEHIGVRKEAIDYLEYNIDKETFLRYIEFIFNMIALIDNEKSITIQPLTMAAIENIPIILEKMNYKIEKVDEEKYIITKRNADVDSVLTKVPQNISRLLLEYNDFRIQNNIEAKRKILKDIDLYIEKHKEIKGQTDNELYNSIGMVVNKMGVNHPIREEPFKSFKEIELMEWYDKCFFMMLHAIRTVDINKIKNERKELINKD